MGDVIIARWRDVIGDMAAKEEGKVVMLEEESTTITDPAVGEGVRWTEMSTADGDVATIAQEVGGAPGGVGRNKVGYNSVVTTACLSLLGDEPAVSFFAGSVGSADCAVFVPFLF